MDKEQPVATGMKRIRWHISLGLVGCRREGWLDVDEDDSDDEIEKAAFYEMMQAVEWNWFVDDPRQGA